MALLIRRALVIASPFSLPGAPLLGTRADLGGWVHRLSSLRGGAWLPSEIRTLVDPTAAQFRRGMDWVNDADIAYVFVAAHGASVTDRYGDQRDVVVLGQGFTTDVMELVPADVTWSFTLVDACREQSVRSKQAMTEVGGPGLVPRKRTVLQVLQHRQLFDALVRQVPPKHELALACSFDESAFEDADFGGYFSMAMRHAARLGRVRPNYNAWLTTRDCFREAARVVRSRTGDEQAPIWRQTPGRSSLPLAVAVG